MYCRAGRGAVHPSIIRVQRGHRDLRHMLMQRHHRDELSAAGAPRPGAAGAQELQPHRQHLFAKTRRRLARGAGQRGAERDHGRGCEFVDFVQIEHEIFAEVNVIGDVVHPVSWVRSAARAEGKAATHRPDDLDDCVIITTVEPGCCDTVKAAQTGYRRRTPDELPHDSHVDDNKDTGGGCCKGDSFKTNGICKCERAVASAGWTVRGDDGRERRERRDDHACAEHSTLLSEPTEGCREGRHRHRLLPVLALTLKTLFRCFTGCVNLCFQFVLRNASMFAPVTQSQNAPVQQKALLQNRRAEPT